jgi:hypothetical protein
MMDIVEEQSPLINGVWIKPSPYPVTRDQPTLITDLSKAREKHLEISFRF